MKAGRRQGAPRAQPAAAVQQRASTSAGHRIDRPLARAGRTSLEHTIEIRDLGVHAAGEPALAGRGRAVHVWTERASGRSMPWPAEVLARCWAAAAG